jgi:protein-S-isoprenylcysteine O-methyltransferase Ste14
MKIKLASFMGYLIAVIGLFILIEKSYIFSKNPILIICQICCLGIMFWARLTFGFRSFHLTADSTKGKLVTNGPYRWLRHPIYASIIYFSWTCLISYPFIETIISVCLIVGGLLIRMILEEKSLLANYEEYASYSKRTKRLIPFIF